jgi:ribosomal protein S18 acetylase RimI-like enzyme
MTQVLRAGPADWQRLRDVRLRSLAADPSAFASSLEREQGYDEQRWLSWISSSAVLLAIDPALPDQPIGLATLRALPADENAAGELNAMWVEPEQRGTGLGGQLLQAALTSAAAGGYRSVRLWVTDGNLGASTLYERAGFRRTGQTEPLLSDPQLTVHEYLLVLPAGAAHNQ